MARRKNKKGDNREQDTVKVWAKILPEEEEKTIKVAVKMPEEEERELLRVLVRHIK